MANNNYTYYVNGNIRPENMFSFNEYGLPNSSVMKIYTLEYRTTYPGLLFGIGLPVINIENGDFQQGINFDYVSGNPRYPSSSVKGVLRSVFKKQNGEYINIDFLRYVINDDSISAEKINLYEDTIFGKKDDVLDRKHAVVFYDAMLYKENKQKLSNASIEDYITPHKDIYQSPIPIKIMRVSENINVKFTFSFNNDVLKTIDLNEQDVINMFDRIIDFTGIGAKTNYGYGRLCKK